MEKKNVIWRKSITINGSTITLPVGAVVVRFGWKKETPFVWFMFDTANVDLDWEPRTFVVVPSGVEFSASCKYLTTLSRRDSNQLYHVLEDVGAVTAVGSCGTGGCTCAPAPAAVPVVKKVAGSVTAKGVVKPAYVTAGYKVCSVKGCNGKVHAGGMCRKHYDAARRSW